MCRFETIGEVFISISKNYACIHLLYENVAVWLTYVQSLFIYFMMDKVYAKFI